MTRCIYCEYSSISKISIEELKQCVDCRGFFCVDHIQKKEKSGYMCVSCELGMTENFFKQREQTIHPQYQESLI